MQKTKERANKKHLRKLLALSPPLKACVNAGSALMTQVGKFILRFSKPRFTISSVFSLPIRKNARYFCFPNLMLNDIGIPQTSVLIWHLISCEGRKPSAAGGGVRSLNLERFIPECDGGCLSPVHRSGINRYIHTFRRNMRRFVLIYICLAGDFLLVLSVDLKDAPTLGSKDNPRVLSKGTFTCHFFTVSFLQCFRRVQWLESATELILFSNPLQA